MRRWLSQQGVVTAFFLILTLFAFRHYVFGGLVPIQFNLLPAFYSPWKYETWQGYERGVPNKPIGTDNPKLFYPYRKFTTDEFKQRRLPLWNPYVFSGNVHAATYQAAVWYPLSIVYFLLPQADAWSLLILLQPILAGWFTFLFLRSQGLSRRASLFGSIAFAFSGWMIAWWEESIVIVHSMLWLPLALYASARRRWVLLAASFAMSILAGFLQMSIYLFFTVFIWNIFFSRKQLFMVGIAFVMAILIAAVQWVPALEAYLFSPRGTVQATFLFDQYLVPLRHLVTLVAPDFWGNPGSYNYFFPRLFYHEKVIWIGLLPLLFAMLGLRTRFWGIFTLIVLSLGFALPTSWVWYILRLPVLSAAQPARIFVLFAFGASILSAYGLDAWLAGKIAKKRVVIVLTIISLVLVGLWGFVLLARWRVVNDTMLTAEELELYGRYATISLRNLFIPTAAIVVACVVCLYRFRASYFFILAATLVWSFYAADKFLYFSDRRFEFPETVPIRKLKELTAKDFSRVWAYGDASFTPNMLSYYGLYSPEGYDALFPRAYGELLHTIKTGGVASDQIERTDATLKGLSERDPMDQSPIRLRLMALLGVRYVLEYKKAQNKEALTDEERFPPALFSIAWEDDRWRIWEYKNALPRAWLESARGGLPAGEAGLEEVVIDRYDPMSVVLRVSAASAGRVILSDTSAPGWVARVDGKEVPIEPAHAALQSVSVNAGDHTVELSYEPWSFRLGVIVSLVGLGAVPAAKVLLRRKRRFPAETIGESKKKRFRVSRQAQGRNGMPSLRG